MTTHKPECRYWSGSACDCRPRDEQGRFISPNEVARYQITVWDSRDGDIVEKLWEASENDLAEIEDRYRDEPFYDIQYEDL